MAVNMVVGTVSEVLTKALQAPGSDGTPHVGAAAASVILLVGAVLTVFNIWAGLSLAVKRFHDRDKSGWWVLIQLVPVVGAIWAFVENGCLAGTRGPNRFGADPLGLDRAALAFA